MTSVAVTLENAADFPKFTQKYHSFTSEVWRVSRGLFICLFVLGCCSLGTANIAVLIPSLKEENFVYMSAYVI